MDNRAPQLIIMISGSIALVAGIVMVAVQFLHDLKAGGGAAGGSGTGFTVFTVGACLEAIGYVATRPWRHLRTDSRPVSVPTH